jgi:predicted NBD/HSP70 family sugar kinase
MFWAKPQNSDAARKAGQAKEETPPRAEHVADLAEGRQIGVGLVSQGRIHRGASGSAGDIGHLRVPGRAVPCVRGRAGCLEAVAGGWALVRDATQAVADGATGVPP